MVARVGMKKATDRFGVKPLPFVLLFTGASSILTSGHTLRGSGFTYALHGQEWTTGECGSRERQSPVDFSIHAPWDCEATDIEPSSPDACTGGAAWFNYDQVSDKIRFVTGGSGTVLADLAGRGYGGVTLHGEYFSIQSVSFRAQSEHTFNGKHLPLEAQLIHKAEDSDHLLIVSLLVDTQPAATLLEIGAQNALSSLLAGLPTVASGGPEKVTDVVLLDPVDVLEPLVANATFFLYSGSMTEPPCTERVTWLVRREPIRATQQLVDRVKSVVISNNGGSENWRATMPSMGRLTSVMLARQGVQSERVSMAPVSGEPAPHPLAEMGADFEGSHTAKEAFAGASWAANAVDVVGRVIVQPNQGGVIVQPNQVGTLVQPVQPLFGR